MTDNDDLRERDGAKCIICGEPRARHNMGHGIPTCRFIATYRSATPIEALQQRVERLEGAINSVTLWMLHRFGPDSPEGKEAQTARAALTQAPRSCCAEERDRCAKIAEDYGNRDWFEVGKVVKQSAREIATAIRSQP